METLHLIFTIIQVILAVALVVIVTMQSGKNSGLSSAITGGGSDSFMSKIRASRSMQSSPAPPSGSAACSSCSPWR